MRLLRRLSHWLHASREAAALSEELEHHRRMLEQEARAAGHDSQTARGFASRRLGNSTLAAEDARRVWLAAWLESVLQDLRYAARALRAQPSFTFLALLALVLGAGLSTSLFTVWNALALRPWPVQDPASMVTLFRYQVEKPDAVGGFPLAQYRYLAASATSLSGIIAMRDEPVRLDNQPGDARTSAHFVSGNYFSLLGAGMTLGRGLTPQDDRLAAPSAVAVLSHAAWQARFGADPAILGRLIRVDDVPFTVVGVASADFTGTSAAPHDLWLPISAYTLARPGSEHARNLLHDPGHCCSSLAARLKPGVTRAAAAAELAHLAKLYPLLPGEKPHAISVAGTAFLSRPDATRKAAPVLALLAAAIAAILLLACANVGNLLLARSAARRREFAIRLSIGAGRRRIVRQLLTEGLLLSALAAALALAVAWFLPAYIIARATDDPPRFQLTPDLTVLVWSLGLTVLCTALFALAPALRATRVDPAEALKDSGAGASPRLRLRSVLLGFQVAVSVMLLVCGALLVRALHSAGRAQPGFAVDGLQLLSVELPVNAYPQPRAESLYTSLLAEFPHAPAMAFLPPLGNAQMWTFLDIPGHSGARLQMQRANAAFFDTLRIPILAGRNFQPADLARRSIIINETMAKRFWPAGGALGKVLADGNYQCEIVGIAADMKLYTLGPTEPTIFESFAGGQRAALIVPGPAAAERARHILLRLEPRAAIVSGTLENQVQRALGGARAAAALASALGLLALLLAAIGVYGVFAYSVEQRRREIGIRIALGAAPARVARHVLASHALPIVSGLIAGLALSSAASLLLRKSLYGVSRLDPLAHLGALVILAAAGVAATLAPALRATRTPPRSALHAE